MKECNKCKITIQTNHQYCPLCHQVLTGENKEDHVELYPDTCTETKNMSPKVERLLLFISIVFIITLAVLNVFNQKPELWSLIPISSIVYFLLVIRFSVFSKQNSVSRITLNTIFVILLVTFINYRTNPSNMWAVDYVLPSLIMTNNFIIFLILLFRYDGIRRYARQLFLITLMSFIPLLLVYLGYANVNEMAILTLGHGGLILIFMLIFYPKVLKEILKRMFHI